MTFALHMELYDPPVAAKKGRPGEIGFSFDGMTREQCETAERYLNAILRKLAQWKEREMGLVKHGSGEVIKEPVVDQQGEQAKTAQAKGPWSVEDEQELDAELRDG